MPCAWLHFVSLRCLMTPWHMHALTACERHTLHLLRSIMLAAYGAT